MDCSRADGELSELLDGELSGAPEAELERHLAHCGSCRAKWTLLRAVQDAVREAPLETVSERFATELLSRVEAEKLFPRPALRGAWRPAVLLTLGSAASLLGFWLLTALPLRELRRAAPEDPFLAVRPDLCASVDDGLTGADEGLRPCASARACGRRLPLASPETGLSAPSPGLEREAASSKALRGTDGRDETPSRAAAP